MVQEIDHENPYASDDDDRPNPSIESTGIYLDAMDTGTRQYPS
jgi:hypothetical protein